MLLAGNCATCKDDAVTHPGESMKTVRFAAFATFIALLITTIGAAEKAKTVPVTGIVQDENGKPLADVIVESGYGGHRYSTQSGADGKFTLDVEPGPLRFEQTKLDIPLLAKTRDGAMM